MSTQPGELWQEWADKAYEDFRVASRLLELSESPAIIGFHLHQAVEKTLKGYLLSKGWRLRRIHDLEVLINEASTYMPDLKRFGEICQRLNPYYLEQRYPSFGTPLSLEQVRRDWTEASPLFAALGLSWGSEKRPA